MQNTNLQLKPTQPSINEAQNDNLHPEPSDNNPRIKTLFLAEHGTTLGKEHERFTLKKDGKIIKRIPLIHVNQIMIFGNSQLTTQVMQFCLQQNIPIYLLSGQGRYFGMIDAFSTDSVTLHKQQFKQADNPRFCLELAKQLIKGKITNTRLILKRLTRHRQAQAFENGSIKLNASLRQISQAQTLDQLRGIEGNAAHIYFQAIATTVDPKWNFHKRNKQPPTDPINAMLSYGYTLLFYNVYSFLRTRGLNPHIGHLHAMRTGHPALASDLMEEFRSIIVDAVVLNIVLNNKLNIEDFEIKNNYACHLNAKARGLFIRQIENKLNAALTHPISGLKLDYRRCIEHQVKNLANHIKNPETPYQPCILR